MSLHKRTLIIISLTIISLITISYVTSRSILLSSFSRLEEQYAVQNVERASALLSNEISDLDRSTHDWASWDQTYAFINDEFDQFRKVNLVDSVFTTLRLNVMLFVHSSGRVVFSRAFDFRNEKEIPFPQSLQACLLTKTLLNHTDGEGNITGIVLLPQGPMLISSRPILTSEEKGPVRGTVIFGRFLDNDEISRLAGITLLSLNIHLFNDLKLPSDFLSVHSALIKDHGTKIIVHPLNSQTIAGYIALKDIYGRPALILKAEMPRDVYKQGQIIFDYLILSLLTIGIVFALVIFILLDKLVLNRLENLRDSVISIRTSGNLSMRIPVKGTDELSSLADEINKMLEAQEHAEKVLQSYTLSDELTGLYNRRGFMTLAEQQVKIADRMKGRMLLIFADVDDLKMINDTLGHLEGDRALIDTAHLIRETFRESDIVARIGGDEFVVFTMETYEINAEVLISRLQENLDAFNAKSTRRYKLAVSVGIARYDPEKPSSIDELLARADRLMYEHKQSK